MFLFAFQLQVGTLGKMCYGALWRETKTVIPDELLCEFNFVCKQFLYYVGIFLGSHSHFRVHVLEFMETLKKVMKGRKRNTVPTPNISVLGDFSVFEMHVLLYIH